MERENDSHMDKYLRKHLRGEMHDEKGPAGRLPQPHFNLGKGRGGNLQYMKETPPPSNGKGAPNLCHSPDCDGWITCMPQLQHKQKTKDGQEVKQLDHFCCMIPCGYCGKVWHYDNECHIKRCESEKFKKAREEWGTNAAKGKPERGGRIPGRSPGKGNRAGGHSVMASNSSSAASAQVAVAIALQPVNT